MKNLLKSFRCSAKSGKAHAQYLKGNLRGSHDIYLSVLKLEPEEFILDTAYAGLAEIEHQWGNRVNSKYYAEQYLISLESYSGGVEDSALEARHAKMRKYAGIDG